MDTLFWTPGIMNPYMTPEFQNFEKGKTFQEGIG